MRISKLLPKFRNFSDLIISNNPLKLLFHRERSVLVTFFTFFKINLYISVPTPIQSVLTPKINHGQRFVCACGRSFATEIAIRETTNVETTSPPATPMLSFKTDMKHQQHSQESFSKRPRILMIEPPTSAIPTTSTLVDRLNPSTMINNWQTLNLKTYEDSPGLSPCFFDYLKKNKDRISRINDS